MNKIYDYQTKFKGHIKYNEPANISFKASLYIQKLIPKLVEIFGLRNLFRVDAIINKAKVFVLEINTLPFLAQGGEPYEAVKNKGLSMYDFIKLVVYDFMTYERNNTFD